MDFYKIQVFMKNINEINLLFFFARFSATCRDCKLFKLLKVRVLIANKKKVTKTKLQHTNELSLKKDKNLEYCTQKLHAIQNLKCNRGS